MKWLAYIGICIILLSSVYALEIDPNINLATKLSSQTVIHGWLFNVSDCYLLKNVTFGKSDCSISALEINEVWLLNGTNVNTNKVMEEACNQGNTFCPIASTVKLRPNVNYYLAGGDTCSVSGSGIVCGSHEVCVTNSGLAYPYKYTQATIRARMHSTTTIQNDTAWFVNIEKFGIEEVECDAAPDYSVTLNWNLINNSNHTNLYLPIYFNGTLGEDVSNTTFVCDLKVNETINSTAAYDLEDNNLINFSVGTRYGYLNFLLNCTNSYGNDTIGFYKLFFNTSYSQAATTTTTVNLTAVESLLEEINEGNNMISIMILYIGLLALGFWLIRNGNFISGVLTLGMSIILDFVIIAGLYNIYQPKVIDATGSYLAYLQIFLITFGSLWLALKIGLVLLVKGKRFKY